MKLEQLIVHHFYNTKQVTLQGLGTFKLSDDFILPLDNDKDVVMPENAISFEYNPKAGPDEELINYVVKQTRKMRSLAAADMESFLILGKQFLNIGKPFIIDGLGVLTKDQQEGYSFKQGQHFHVRAQPDAIPAKDKPKEEEISFASDINPKNTSRKTLLITTLVIFVGILSTTIWFFVLRKPNNNTQNIVQNTVVSDTPVSVSQPVLDTLASSMKPVKKEDGYTFKVVFLVTTDSATASAKMNKYTAWGHHIIMYTDDSVTYKLAEPFKLPLSDTTRIKDSLNSYYYLGKGFIELN